MSQPAKNPNAVDLPRTDGKCATGGCPHLKEKVQLIPLRYGLVERLDPSPELYLPYKTTSRPMGIRLLRDGWLYVIDNSTGYLHEYEVKAGAVTKCIWQGKEVSQDKRTGSAGENALIFTRGSTLHVAYAEVQWTANKCSQMLKSPKERDLFMQKVNPAGADAEKGGKHLLTDKQAEKWIAEVAEKPATATPPKGAHADESKDYIWEDQKDLFKATQLGAIKKSLLPVYEKDHFFLVFKDSIGVMRDLAQDQDTVVGWLEEWALKEKNDLKYSIGNYIETLMVVSEKSAKQAGTSDALFEKTTPEQREKIYDYVNAKNDLSGIKTSQPEKAYYPGRGFDAKTRAAQQTVALKKQTMEDSLGKDLYKDLKDDIEVLEDKSHAAVEGKGLGARGIHDLVRHEEMTQYLESERSHMKRWTARLNRITTDRVTLFTKSEYHMSAWYYDADVPDQLEQALITELNCVRDLCRTEESIKVVGEFFHGAPYYSLPSFASRLDEDFLIKKTGDVVKLLDDTRGFPNGLEEANKRVTDFDAVLGQHWAENLSPSNLNITHAINAAYSPAIALRLQTWLSKIQSSLNGPQLKAHLDKISSHSNRAHRLGLIYAIKHGRATLKIATDQDKNIFLERLNKLGSILSSEEKIVTDRDSARKIANRRVASSDELGKSRKANAKAEETELNRQLSATRKERLALTSTIQESLIATNAMSSGFVGVQLKIDPAQQVLLKNEIQRLRIGAIKGYGEPGASAALSSSSIPLIALLFQAWNFREAYETWDKLSGNSSIKEDVIFYGAFSGVMSAALSVYQNAYIALVEKGFKATVMSTGGKGGALFMAKLGKLGLGLGALISPIGLLSSVGTTLDNWNKWTDALLTGTGGEKAGALMALTGDVGNTAIMSITTTRSVRDLSSIGRIFVTTPKTDRIVAVGRAWGTKGVRFLSFSTRLTPWSLGFTALQLGGESLYNYFNLDDQQRWMSNSCWGLENKDWDMSKHAQMLAEVNLRPVIVDAGIVKEQNNGGGVRTIGISFPGVSIEKLGETPIRIQAGLISQSAFQEVDVGLTISGKLKITSRAPLILKLEIPDEWCSEQSKLTLRMSVQPDIATAPLKADDGYLTYPISLNFSATNKPLKGEPSVKYSKNPLKWVDINMENLSA
ncbi:toxin VasX [Pseudomonas sp. S2_H08]